MIDILVNLKRFDVPREMGGLCPDKDPGAWIEWVIQETVRLGIHTMGARITYFLPEALLLSAAKELASLAEKDRSNLALGSQSVFREDVSQGGNFGAFTANLPAAAAANMGCTWTIIGHSEERKDKLETLCAYDERINHNEDSLVRANQAVDGLLNRQTIQAFQRGLNVCFCVGETAKERGEGTFEEQRKRIKAVLRAQLEMGLKGAQPFLSSGELVVGYEPRWAIGPGKTPPGPDYIAFVSAFIKECSRDLHGFEPKVVYGGGLKKENAQAIAAIPTIDGGLVALTKFTQPIAFDPEQFKMIIQEYLKGGQR